MKNKAFLELLAAYLYSQYGKELAEYVIVFPNRRAGLFFKQYLSKQADKVIWSPEIVGISELVNSLSDLYTGDPVDLLFELYKCYSELVSFPEPIDEFWFWGEMMISDFDEIDKYMVDAGSLFTNILELKEIDEHFGDLEPEQIAFIRQFWSNFHLGADTKEKDSFKGIWGILHPLYLSYKKALSDKGLAYEGMIYRDVAENIAEKAANSLKWGKVIFAGFNALNSCEKRMFSALKNSGRAEFFWDYDRSYLDDRNKEAGRFMRENLLAFQPPVQLEDFSSYEGEKEIRIFDLPGDILQARIVSDILSKEGRKQYLYNDTAIVLCDENLLQPVLTSIPDTVDEINVTMGYPLLFTPVFGLVDAMLSLQANTREQKDGRTRFYFRDVESILNHQYIRLLNPDAVDELREKIIRGNMIYVDQEEFSGELERLIFNKVADHLDFCRYFRDFFVHLSSLLDTSEQSMQTAMEKEYIHLLNARLNKLAVLLKGREDISLQVFTRLFRKMIRSLRIPFSGEPLAGLQVMGILETRLLDFNHVILLSVNEDIMPRPNRAQSFIPNTLRYAYRMPSREDLDAIYAYYFHRLLQRAEKADLLFNSVTEGLKSGEMSRYLHQLKFSRKLEIIHPGLSQVTGEEEDISVVKDGAVYETLQRYIANKEGKSERYLSPSALNTYIDCPLKFYLRYIAGIGEEDEVVEEVDQIYFGNLLHEAISRIYLSLSTDNGTLERESLKQMRDSKIPEAILTDVFRELFFRGREGAVPEGKNIIIFRVILKYINKIIETDMKVAPVEDFVSEKEFRRILPVSIGGTEIQIGIGGKIDRIDSVNGQLRVLDYKTGRAEKEFNSIESLFDGNDKKRNRAGFQTLLYAWMVNRKNILPGLYVIRDLFKEDFSPAFVIGTRSEKRMLAVFDEFAPEYMDRLKTLVQELFTASVPFYQTKVAEQCERCDFKQICRK